MGTFTEFLDNLSLEQLNERLELALNGAGLGIWDWDPRDNSVQFDRRWCEMLGLDHASTPMALETWQSRVHPDDLAACFADISAHVSGKTPVYENIHRMRHADGRWIYILDRGRVVSRDAEGNPTRFTGTHFDVTATERAKQVLAHQERQMADLIRNMPTCVAIMDRDYRYIAVSERWLQQNAVQRDQVIGRQHGDLFPGADPRWSQIHRQGMEGESQSRPEDRFDMPDVGPCWMRWTVVPWHTLTGEVGGIIEVTEDITGEVKQRSMREQETRMASLGVMAGAVGHEINTPLQVILLEAQEMVAVLDEGSVNVSELRTSADIIQSTTERIADIVRAMRSLSRDSSGDPVSDVNVAELCKNVEALSRGRLKSRRIVLTMPEVAPGLCVRGNAPQLGQVLLNLLSNAIDAVESQNDRWISFGVAVEKTFVVFRCVDSGPGVKAEHRTSLMQPFFTTKPVGKGTGLGLSVSLAIAARLNGFLRLETNTQHTTFAFGVPISETGTGGNG